MSRSKMIEGKNLESREQVVLNCNIRNEGIYGFVKKLDILIAWDLNCKRLSIVMGNNKAAK